MKELKRKEKKTSICNTYIKRVFRELDFAE
jgi:hypothetical protein